MAQAQATSAEVGESKAAVTRDDWALLLLLLESCHWHSRWHLKIGGSPVSWVDGARCKLS